MNENLEQERLFAEKLEKMLKRFKNLEKKIPPEVYENYLENIEIIEGSVATLDCYIDQTFNEKKIKLEPVTQPELVRAGRKPIVQLTTILRFYELQKNAKDSTFYEDQEELAHINITFQATYKNAGKAPKEFWELYTFHTAPHDLWQFIRHYLYSLLKSMNIKNYELPLEFDDLMYYQYETIHDILSDCMEKKNIDNM